MNDGSLQSMVIELSESVMGFGEKIRKQQIALDTLRVAVAVALDRERHAELLQTLSNLEKNQVESDSSVEVIKTARAIFDALKNRNVGQA